MSTLDGYRALPPGRVDAGARDGQDADAERDARLVVAEAGVALVLVEGADARGGELHGVAHVGREARERGGAGVLAQRRAAGARRPKRSL